MHGNLAILRKFKQKKILVIGDLILDQYIRGSVSRLSPEAPVPVVLEEENFYTPGGAANVASNLTSLKAHVTLLGRMGQDAEGKILLKELKRRRISTDGIFVDRRIPTPLKTRILAQRQQVVRVDRERKEVALDEALREKIFDFLKRRLSSFDAVIISDYGKGMIVPELVDLVCRLAVKGKKVIVVDPKVEHFSYYRGVTAITPNRSEAENAIRNIKIREKEGSRLQIHSDQLKSDADINLAGEELLKYLDLESLLITLGEHGMRLFERNKPPQHIQTRAREVFDVSGAGDTVVAVFTLSLACGANKHSAADLANFAAGVVVGKLGTVPITPEELTTAIKEA